MAQTVVWMFIFFLAYGAFCLFIGIRTSRLHTDPKAFFAPSGGIGTWVFVIAITAAMFAGWTVTGQPGQVFRNAFQYVNASLFVITVPLAGVLVQKRQWLMAQKYGHVTSGDMYAGYFGSSTIALISAGIAVLFAVPFLAILFSAAAALMWGLSDGSVSREVAMWGLAGLILVYSALGGIRAASSIGVVQGVLFAGAVIILGVFAIDQVGGITVLGQWLAASGSAAGESARTHGFGGGDYPGMLVVPGVVQWTSGLGLEQSLGGPWTAVMGLSFALSMMGLQFAPGFTTLGMASRNVRAFSIHQIWGSAFCVGLLMLLFSTFQGMGAHLLGADGSANLAGLAKRAILPELSGAQQGDLVQQYIRAIGANYPWLMGLLAVAAIAAIQSTSAIILASSGNILARDVYKRHIQPGADWADQKQASAIFMLLLCLAALMLASFAMQATLVLAALAIPMSFQLLPALVGVLWWPWIPQRAVVFGLIAGLIVVVLTEPLGQILTGYALPWGKWPFTIHSGVWGMLFNLLICLLTASFSRNQVDHRRREAFHTFLNSASGIPTSSRAKSVAWTILLFWTFFAAGPGSVLGNALFGDPSGGIETWVFALPSIWAWTLFWWALGVGLVWFLAVKIGMSVLPEQRPITNTVVRGVSDNG